MSGEPIRDDQILVRYLLGSLPEDQTERLDELSVADEDFVWRLRAAENDLVDAYVRNELSGEAMERFRSFYLASMPRREKVKFAETLLTLKQEPAPARSWFTAPMAMPRWGLGGALAATLLIAGILVYDNARLRDRVHQAEANFAVAPQERAPLVALVLTPPVRGGGPTPSLAVPSGADRAAFVVKLEADDFSVYQAALKDAAGSRTLWRSGELKSSGAALSVAVPASLLAAGDYILALSSAGPNSESIANYPFKVVPR